jgi:hypothetical protein
LRWKKKEKLKSNNLHRAKTQNGNN